ncbi:MAG TPA: hypothetical protein P5186_13680 [Candidatus Paceibacterota bacterium]|nr:hypothetical protein [Candidatus Paceibacterota bacterium]
MNKNPLPHSLGQVVITRSAHESINTFDILSALRRHAAGDCGKACPSDKAENDLPLREGFQLLSAYTDRNGNKFWIITEADRSATTVLLPEDY